MRIETTRWIWLAVIAIGLARPAAADEARPATAPGKYRLAVLDMPAPGERAQAARLVVEAVRGAAAADPRVDVVPAELVAEARTLWGGRDVLVLTDEAGAGSGLNEGNDEMTLTQTCAIGHAAGAERLLVIDGYELALSQVPGGTQARLGARLSLINVESCRVRERDVVRADGAAGTSVEEALAGTRVAFATAVQERLQGLLPLHSAVRAVSRRGGEMEHGARAGVRPGQYFDVKREERVIGHVYVDDVDPESAEVSLVRGVRRLQPGDRLIERKPVRVFEVGMAATPSTLERNGREDALGVAAAVHGMMYRPVGSNMYGFSIERLGFSGFTRWRAGVDFGRQVRILPRRLFAYARLGAGLVWARQKLQDPPPGFYFYGGGFLRGYEITNALGLKYTLGDGLVMHLSASMPIGLNSRTWYYDHSDRIKVPEEMLVFPRSHRQLPTVSLGLGWTF